MIIVGDIHGRLRELNAIARKNKSETIVQIGDFGFGFGEMFDIDGKLIEPNIRFFRGNHDSPELCNAHPQSLGDFGLFEGMFFVAGADSIDKDMRIEGQSWWRNEELTIQQFNEAIDQYSAVEPEVVLTHDCPQSIARDYFGIPEVSRTRQGLQAMLEIHRPKLWIFGHHHRHFVKDDKGCVFRCLPELQTYRLPPN